MSSSFRHLDKNSQGRKKSLFTCFSPWTEIRPCAVTGCQLCVCGKISVFGCRKSQLAEKLVFIIYWPLWTRLQLTKSYRRPHMLDSFKIVWVECTCISTLSEKLSLPLGSAAFFFLSVDQLCLVPNLEMYLRPHKRTDSRSFRNF